MEKQYGKVERAKRNLGFIVGNIFRTSYVPCKATETNKQKNKQTKTKETAVMKKSKFKI